MKDSAPRGGRRGGFDDRLDGGLQLLATLIVERTGDAKQQARFRLEVPLFERVVDKLALISIQVDSHKLGVDWRREESEIDGAIIGDVHLLRLVDAGLPRRRPTGELREARHACLMFCCRARG